uniref:Uncharacterized protein n=1 Tax=Kalmanozyma brasiliensis (strain GHG001) TaxID=1365824 RepID=V5EXX3_KALBG
MSSAQSLVVKALLADYIKPIIQEAGLSSSGPQSSIDPITGRRKPPASQANFVSHLDANLGRHRHSADEDEGASNLAPSRFALTLPSESRALEERNEALGCTNVLSLILTHLSLTNESDWTAVWPLLIPPLLTLAEHPQPRFRLRGSALVYTLLERGGEALAKLLLRTGIGSLLEKALHVNLTYIHDETYAAGLLSCSIGALRLLILLSTSPIAYRLPLSGPGGVGEGRLSSAVGDCGEKRQESLTRLVSEGILSTWSYLPLPPAGTHLGRSLVHTTVTAYLVLIDDLSPPALDPSSTRKGLGSISRFVDVSLDWIARNWLSTVPFLHLDEIPLTEVVLSLATRLTADGAGRWVGPLLAAVAKCWISSLESPLRQESEGDERWARLEEGLRMFLGRLAQVDASVGGRWGALREVDGRLGVLEPI